jgi:NAD(P)H-dependent flavin oxidoreductase YrpB (nitropropane dioxygenase family)
VKTRLCEMFGIEFPIFAFSHCRDVVAAVSRAGGLGVLGALAFSPEELEQELAWIDAHVGGKPYGVDVVMPARTLVSDQKDAVDKGKLEQMIPAPHKQFVDDVLRRFEIPALPAEAERSESLLGWTPSAGRGHVDVALAHPIKLLVNALGPPPAEIVALAHQHGVKVAALVGTAAQAKKQVEVGVDLIVAQGSEAGGHTGEITTMVLVPDVVDAVAPVPVLAAGGIGSGRQAAAALALGADGVWTGSLWLAVKESDYHPVLIEKILKASSSDTVRAKLWTGKPARLLKTKWTDAWESDACPGTLPMPLQYMLTAEAQQRIGRAAAAGVPGGRELVGTPIGQIAGRINQVKSSQDVVYGMVEEFVDVVEKLKQQLGE